MDPDSHTLIVDRALRAVNGDAASLRDAQEPAEAELAHKIDVQLAIDGVPSSERMREGFLEDFRRQVEAKYPGLAACANGGAFTEQALIELLPQHGK
jgi:hypothetical protein